MMQSMSVPARALNLSHQDMLYYLRNEDAYKALTLELGDLVEKATKAVAQYELGRLTLEDREQAAEALAKARAQAEVIASEMRGKADEYFQNCLAKHNERVQEFEHRAELFQRDKDQFQEAAREKSKKLAEHETSLERREEALKTQTADAERLLREGMELQEKYEGAIARLREAGLTIS